MLIESIINIIKASNFKSDKFGKITLDKDDIGRGFLIHCVPIILPKFCKFVDD